MGLFEHEAASVDPLTRQIYLTEDHERGCLYRFTPDAALASRVPDLASGVLEVAVVSAGFVTWETIPDPLGKSDSLRAQVEAATRFAGGEGIDIFDRYLRFTTKYDNRVWQLDLVNDSIEVIQRLNGRVNDVDDLTHTADGAILLAEDGPAMRILYLAGPGADPVTLVQLPDHEYSEITGLAFDPSATRLYFSSQRGSTDHGVFGLTFELSGDFASLRTPFELRERILDHADLQI
jgi:secreted PhoX family phosphatase